jgi:oxygen-independent coproporphyrinogen-3 oxidase
VLHADTLPPWQGMSVFQYLSPLFAVWQQHGLVTLCENKLQLTLAGQFWSVTLAQACIHVLQSL